MRQGEALTGLGGANSPILGRQLLLSRLSDAVQAGTQVPAILSRASLYLSTTVGINLFPCAVCRSFGQLSLQATGLWICHVIPSGYALSLSAVEALVVALRRVLVLVPVLAGARRRLRDTRACACSWGRPRGCWSGLPNRHGTCSRTTDTTCAAGA